MHCMGATELLSIFSQSIERTYELKLFSQWNEPKVPALLAFPTTFLAKQIFYGPPKMHCFKKIMFLFYVILQILNLQENQIFTRRLTLNGILWRLGPKRAPKVSPKLRANFEQIHFLCWLML